MACWFFTDHALSRGASRVGLIMDMGVQAKISDALSSDKAVLLTIRRGSHLYEIPVLGTTIIAVCKVETKVVITFLDAKRWYKSQYAKHKRKHHGPESSAEEE